MKVAEEREYVFDKTECHLCCMRESKEGRKEGGEKWRGEEEGKKGAKVKI